MQAAWLAHGFDAEQFWRLTPRDIVRVLEGARERISGEHRLHRMRNHELAQLITIGFHKPKKLPKFDEGTGRKGPVSQEVAQAKVRAALIAMSMRSGGRAADT